MWSEPPAQAPGPRPRAELGAAAVVAGAATRCGLGERAVAPSTPSSMSATRRSLSWPRSPVRR